LRQGRREESEGDILSRRGRRWRNDTSGPPLCRPEGGGSGAPVQLRQGVAAQLHQGAAARTWRRQGTAPARGGDGGSKGQRRRREQARLGPKNRLGEGGFGAGAAEDFAVREEDFAPEVGESAREQGDGGPAPLGKKSEAGEEMARPIASGEG